MVVAGKMVKCFLSKENVENHIYCKHEATKLRGLV